MVITVCAIPVWLAPNVRLDGPRSQTIHTVFARKADSKIPLFPERNCNRLRGFAIGVPRGKMMKTLGKMDLFARRLDRFGTKRSLVQIQSPRLCRSASTGDN